jgi:hypothetical protein
LNLLHVYSEVWAVPLAPAAADAVSLGHRLDAAQRRLPVRRLEYLASTLLTDMDAYEAALTLVLLYRDLELLSRFNTPRRVCGSVYYEEAGIKQ